MGATIRFVVFLSYDGIRSGLPEYPFKGLEAGLGVLLSNLSVKSATDSLKIRY